jgi:DNA-binding transcriptional MerR regulator
MVKKYTIHQMAQLTGLSIHTLRYYDSLGITPSVERSTSGYRTYTEDDVRGLLFIKRLRDTGMPLREIQRYVELYLQGDDTIEARRDLLEQHRRQIETSIVEMQDSLNLVNAKIAIYDQQCSDQSCNPEDTEITNLHVGEST